MKITRSRVESNKALKLFFLFYMNKLSEYETKQVLQELSLGRLNYNELLIRETKKPQKPPGSKNLHKTRKNSQIQNKENNLIKNDEERNIELLSYVFDNVRGFYEFQYIKRLTHEDIKNISRYIKYEFYPKDSYIYRQGDKSEKFFGLIEGEIQVMETNYIDTTRIAQDGSIKLFDYEIIRNENRENVKSKDEHDDISLKFFVSNRNSIFDQSGNNNKKIKLKQKLSLKNFFYDDYDFYFDDYNEKYRNHSCEINLSKLTKYQKTRLINKKITLSKNYKDIIKNQNAKILHKIFRVFRYHLKDKKKTMKNCYSFDDHKEYNKKHRKYFSVKNSNNEYELKNVKLLTKNLQHFSKIIKSGNYFGEKELCKRTLRKDSLYCLSDCHVFTLSKEYFEKYLLNKIVRSELLKSKFIVEKLDIINRDSRLYSLIPKISVLLLYKDYVIYTPFDKAEYLYLVYQGECAICETLKNYNNKKEFLSDNSRMKNISILKEGGFGGLEGFQNDVNYENYMVVIGHSALVLKINIKEFDNETGKFCAELEKMFYQQKKLILSVKRKGLFFELGRQITKSNELKASIKDYVKKARLISESKKLKNKVNIKRQEKIILDIPIRNNHTITNKNENIFNTVYRINDYSNKKNNINYSSINQSKLHDYTKDESSQKESNYNNSITTRDNKLANLTKLTLKMHKNINNEFNYKNEINKNSFSTKKSKVYLPIKELLSTKEPKIEDAKNVLTSLIFPQINTSKNDLTIEKVYTNQNIKQFSSFANSNMEFNSFSNSSNAKKIHSFYNAKTRIVNSKKYFFYKNTTPRREAVKLYSISKTVGKSVNFLNSRYKRDS